METSVNRYDDRQKILEQISEAFKSNLVNDVTFSLTDGSIVKSSKFMLCCRSEYFRSLLLTEFKEKEMEVIPLQCDLPTFNIISDYIFEGIVDFTQYHVGCLLPAMEKTREYRIADGKFSKAIEDYLINTLSSVTPDADYVEKILQFSTDHQSFEGLKEVATKVFIANVNEMVKSEEFGNLSESALEAILKMKSTADVKELDFLESLVRWMKLQEHLTESSKTSLLSMIDLRKFAPEELVDNVRNYNLFSSDIILDIVNEQLRNRKIIEEETRVNTELARKNEEEKTRVNTELARKNVCLVSNGGSIICGANYGKSCIDDQPSKSHSEGYTKESYSFVTGCSDSRIVVKFKEEFELNKIEFLLNSSYSSNSYIVETKCEGEEWSVLIDSRKVCSGKQTITFKPKKMQYISVRRSSTLTGGLCLSINYISALFNPNLPETCLSSV